MQLPKSFCRARVPFCEKVESRISSGWLVENKASVHCERCCVLPLLARVQEHKSTTSVRPCFYYRQLNKRLILQPGAEAQCVKKLEMAEGG